jgi:hypothetical protein
MGSIEVDDTLANSDELKTIDVSPAQAEPVLIKLLSSLNEKSFGYGIHEEEAKIYLAETESILRTRSVILAKLLYNCPEAAEKFFV